MFRNLEWKEVNLLSQPHVHRGQRAQRLWSSGWRADWSLSENGRYSPNIDINKVCLASGSPALLLFLLWREQRKSIDNWWCLVKKAPLKFIKSRYWREESCANETVRFYSEQHWGEQRELGLKRRERVCVCIKEPQRLQRNWTLAQRFC